MPSSRVGGIVLFLPLQICSWRLRCFGDEVYTVFCLPLCTYCSWKFALFLRFSILNTTVRQCYGMSLFRVSENVPGDFFLTDSEK